MIAILTTRCGCSRVIKVTSPPPIKLYVPFENPGHPDALSVVKPDNSRTFVFAKEEKREGHGNRAYYEEETET